MNFNFEEDIKHTIRHDFSGYGIVLPSRKDLHQSLTDYFTIAKKMIRPVPRTVDVAPDLLKSLPEHPKQDEIKYLADCFTNGKDVNLFQNKRLFQPGFHDHLAYEWNIYHLHLSFEKERKNHFQKQVKSLLFVYILPERAILLGTDNHSTPFGSTRWQEILHDHFPEAIEEYKDGTIQDVSPKLSGKERQELWDKGYTLGMTKVRDTIYHNPGIGRSTSGHSSIVISQTIRIERWLFTINDQFQEYYEKVCKAIAVDPEKASFRLQFGKRTFEVVETTSDTTILTYPEYLNTDLLDKP